MVDATCEIEVHAPAGVIYAVIWDVGRYPEFLSDVIDAQVHATPNANVQEAAYRVQLFREVAYRVRMVGDRPARVSWQRIAGDDTGDGYLQRNDGAWRIEPTDDGRSCRLHYELTIEFGLPLPDAMVSRLVDFNLPTLLRQMKARAEAVTRQAQGGL